MSEVGPALSVRRTARLLAQMPLGSGRPTFVPCRPRAYAERTDRRVAFPAASANNASVMARLRLRTFGGLSLEGMDAANGAMPKGRRTLALLALLAKSGSRGLSRDKVTALLWPDSDAERGRNSLSQVLSSLRRDVGPGDLVSESILHDLNASRSHPDPLYARNILTAYALLRGQIARVRPQLEQARALVVASGERPFPLQGIPLSLCSSTSSMRRVRVGSLSTRGTFRGF
jgi:hypothetical protein